MAVHDMLMAAGGGTAGAVNYIDDVFSTYLYTGNGSTQTITNGIDLSTKGGLVWTKSRTTTAWHEQTDTIRGASKYVSSNSTNAQQNSQPNHVTAFNSNGFSVGSETDVNANGVPFASWTFAKQAKFFDVVTWTGDGTGARTIAHNLGSVPGCIFLKPTSYSDDWHVYHRGLSDPANYELFLNLTSAESGSTAWNTLPTSTNFTAQSYFNTNGATYVAYLFAHDAGGFGASGADNVISCGSFNSGGSGTTVSLGYEPQWILWKRATGAANNWKIYDTMRGMTTDATGRGIYPNSSTAEVSDGGIAPTATGFNVKFGDAETYIYIAIRRPMKPPTTGTEVFSPVIYTGNGVNTTRIINTTITPDLVMLSARSLAYFRMQDRLRGNKALYTSATNAESATSSNLTTSQTGYDLYGDYNGNGATYVLEAFRRAPGFFDEVCYTGTGSSQTLYHNLGVPPELIIRKTRNVADGWEVAANITASNYRLLYLNQDASSTLVSLPSSGVINSQPTATTITATAGANNYVNYLFASCPGVSKVGSYTGTGGTQTISCGFAARFVLIKRTDSSGDWYVWDTARGIVSGNDPYLLLNSTAAETTGTDYIDPYSAGFEISSTAPAAINASGGTYIYLAIA